MPEKSLRLLSSTSRSRSMLAAFLLTTLVSACNGGRAVDTFCVVNEPIRPTAAQVAKMTDAQVNKTLVHNEFGAKRCGWKP